MPTTSRVAWSGQECDQWGPSSGSSPRLTPCQNRQAVGLRGLETWRKALEGRDPRPEAKPAWFPRGTAQFNPDGGPAALQFCLPANSPKAWLTCMPS